MEHIVINLQPVLTNDLILAIPLKESHFNELYAAASDPLIWEQHPNKNRWQKEAFENYFRGAMESGGALLVRDAVTNEIIGCSRFYDLHPGNKSVSIGYTFFVRGHWGAGYNYALKKLMLDHIFQFVETVHFYIGAQNKRSQVSLERFGAVKTHEEETAYYGEAPKLDYVYVIPKVNWEKKTFSEAHG
jgi:RimJ/RimL family protein N-acetyltransferase